MGWLFGRKKRNVPSHKQLPASGTTSRPARTPSQISRVQRIKQWYAARRAQAGKLSPAQLKERWKRMTPTQRKKWMISLTAAGSAAMLATLGYVIRPRPHDGQVAHPTLIERIVSHEGGVEIVSPVRNGDPGARVEVKPLPGETKKEFEKRLEEWRDVLEPTEKKPPIRIGKFLLIPGNMELDALQRDGSLKEVEDSLGKRLRYDLNNVKEVEYDAEKYVNTYGFDREVPPGSLLRVNVADERGNVFTTYMLMEENGFVYYAYPPGVYGSHDNRQSTGFTGGIDSYLPPNAWVSGYIPPKE
jgi:hypothetical protein